ncbi:MAG: M14 family metallopeptidase, partial [bacterium]|nr:M14 family metallopeptidase [bacterium]
LRNIFTVLDENYSHADFKTRVLASHAFVRSILEFTHKNITEMEKLLHAESVRTREGLREKGWVTEFDVENLHDITIKSYEFNVEKIPESELHRYPPWYNGVRVVPTDRLKDYTVPYFNRTVPTASMALPEAYVIPPVHKNVIGKLEAHGIVMDRLDAPVVVSVEQFQIEKLEPVQRPSQGHVPLEIEGSYENREMTLEAGSVVVSLRQPLARLIPVLLEPSSPDSLLRWGFFSSWVVPQWRRSFNPYPVVRLTEIPEGINSRLN